MTRNSTPYHPALLLASLGAGGLAVSFYLYLLFLTPHPGQPVPTIDTLLALAADTGQSGWWGVPWVLALLFAGLHFWLLFWNIPRYRAYQAAHLTPLTLGDSAFIRFAWPLLLAMSMNAGFVVALLTIPGLWPVIEYIFPLAMLIFIVLGFFTLKQLGALIGNGLKESKPLLAANNLASLMPAFALGMITVGLSGPSAMSHELLTSSIALFFVVLFGVATLLIIVAFGISSLANVLRNGVSVADSYGLMILVPVSTILGIAVFRVLMALGHHFDLALPNRLFFLFFAALIAFQIFILWMGLAVLRRTGAWAALWSDAPVPQVFAIICPGVAFVVMWDFFISRGVASLPGGAALMTVGWMISAALQAFVVYVFLRLVKRLING